MMNENEKVSRSHGLAVKLLQQQSDAIELPIALVPSTWKEYEKKYIAKLKQLTKSYKLEAAVFGDIDIEPNRAWEEKVSEAAGLKAVLPLWKGNRKQLVFDMIQEGIEAIIVSCNTTLGKDFLGRKITKEIVDEFESLGVDACGENGEYHTMVVNCPLFKESISLPEYTKKSYEDYCFIDWS